MDVTESLGKVGLMQAAYAFNLLLKPGLQSHGERDSAILVSFPLAHDDLAPREVDVFHAEPAAFEQAHTGPVEQFRHKASYVLGESLEETPDFVDGEHGGQSVGAFGADGVQQWQRLFEQLVEEEDELPDPADIRFFGAFGVVEQPALFADAIEESGLGCGGRLWLMRVGRGHRAPLARDRPPAIMSTELYMPAAKRSTRATAAPCGLECTAVFVAAHGAVLLAVYRRR